ncbi:hypothetical protein [Galactobacter caseinivorans]|uniref:Uncharacterized protein n=1 Tax=Galactobacter caseinivorans TaxID=2676123 RepID=A0A496PMP4_9MICC|nr:hypothetical protein [Galactobacter caseinivorans]RKW71739.1 hypothetical protein DWQ67_02620 [Galactobacter caseinivorans]
MADILTVTTGKVDCRLAVTTNDQNAPNPLFDTIAPTGYVYLRPRKTAFVASDPGVIVIPDEISLVVDVDGWAVMPDSSGGPSDVRTIDLPAAEGMTWQVSFDLRVPAYPWQTGVAENRLRVAPFDIPVEPGTTTHIADYLPAGVDPSTGTVWVKGDKGDAGPGIKDMVQVDGDLLVELENGRTVGPFDLPASTVPGPASNLGIGTVTTGAEGAPASATVTGAAPDFKLNLTLPRGATGSGGGLPSGGTTNQVPVRASDGGTAWATAASLVPPATTSVPGLLSAADKAKLDAAPTTANVTAAQTNAVASAKTYTDGLVGNQVATMATTNMLVATASMPGAIVSGAYNVRPSIASNFTIFTAPFPLKIVSVTLVQSIATIPVDATNFMAVGWRKVGTNGTTFSTVANKRTNATAWEVHKPWSYDSETQTEANKTMAAGEGLNLSFSVAGTGYYLFPIYVTVRYLPL